MTAITISTDRLTSDRKWAPNAVRFMLNATTSTPITIPSTMRAIRLAFGTMKITGNIATAPAASPEVNEQFALQASDISASGLSQYKAEVCLKRVDISASAIYMLSENWLARGDAGFGFLTGDAADSPIFEKKLQPSASLFVGYKF